MLICLLGGGGGGIPQERLQEGRVGAHRGMTFKVKHIGKFKAISGTVMKCSNWGLSEKKNRVGKYRDTVPLYRHTYI